MRRRLVLGVGLGVPFGALAVVMVVTGAFAGVKLVQIAAFDVKCRIGDPVVPWFGRTCGSGLTRAVPFVSAALGLVLMVMYAGLVRRWIRGLPPRGAWSGIWLAGRALAGSFVGLSALAGGTVLYIGLNDRYWHISCYPNGRGGWICDGNIYYCIHPLVALFTLALLVLYPVLWNTAGQTVDHDRVHGP